MAQTDFTLRVRFAWWWLAYFSLTRFGLWLGVPINPERVVAAAKRAMRVECL